MPLVQTKPHAAYFHYSAALALTCSLRRTHAMLLLPYMIHDTCTVPLALALVTGCSSHSPSPTWCVPPPPKSGLLLASPIERSDLYSPPKKRTDTHTHLSVLYMHATAPTHPGQPRKRYLRPPRTSSIQRPLPPGGSPKNPPTPPRKCQLATGNESWHNFSDPPLARTRKCRRLGQTLP